MFNDNPEDSQILLQDIHQKLNSQNKFNFSQEFKEINDTLNPDQKIILQDLTNALEKMLIYNYQQRIPIEKLIQEKVFIQAWNQYKKDLFDEAIQQISTSKQSNLEYIMVYEKEPIDYVLNYFYTNIKYYQSPNSIRFLTFCDLVTNLKNYLEKNLLVKICKDCGSEFLSLYQMNKLFVKIPQSENFQITFPNVLMLVNDVMLIMNVDIAQYGDVIINLLFLDQQKKIITRYKGKNFKNDAELFILFKQIKEKQDDNKQNKLEQLKNIQNDPQLLEKNIETLEYKLSEKHYQICITQNEWNQLDNLNECSENAIKIAKINGQFYIKSNKEMYIHPGSVDSSFINGTNSEFKYTKMNFCFSTCLLENSIICDIQNPSKQYLIKYIEK